VPINVIHNPLPIDALFGKVVYLYCHLSPLCLAALPAALFATVVLSFDSGLALTAFHPEVLPKN
jgi:hypothetical protein